MEAHRTKTIFENYCENKNGVHNQKRVFQKYYVSVYNNRSVYQEEYSKTITQTITEYTTKKEYSKATPQTIEAYRRKNILKLLRKQ